MALRRKLSENLHKQEKMLDFIKFCGTIIFGFGLAIANTEVFLLLMVRYQLSYFHLFSIDISSMLTLQESNNLA